MATDLNKILSYDSIDLTKFEIRGAKVGISNARTTGPVFTKGVISPQYGPQSYIPASNSISGEGSFSVGSSIVSNVVFDSPYGSLTTSSLKIGDLLVVDSKNFEIINILSPNSYEIDGIGVEGTHGIIYTLKLRDYLIEPDTQINTSTGNASFTQGDKIVSGTGFGILDKDDFIKHDGYQRYFRIDQKINSTTLELVSPYIGDTTSGSYTAKKWTIGRTRVQYAKNNITYDDKSGKWEYDSIMGSDVTTSISFLPLVDGINVAYTYSLSENKPDLMDVATEDFITLASKTQYNTSQFSLPVVPEPETFKLYINDDLKDMYPLGSQDYILAYSSSPLYEPPLPPSLRRIAHVMFLNSIEDVQPNVSTTQSGQIRVIDNEGNEVLGILPDSESLQIDGVQQVSNRDYMLEPYSGVMEIIESAINEDIVKYVGVDFSSYIDYGFEILLNGVQQKISFPAKINDDVLFQVATGALKPRNQEHPGPGDTYRINYMVQSNTISDESMQIEAGHTIADTAVYPIKQLSVFIVKNNDILDEGKDFFVSYLTGRILFEEPFLESDVILISYTPLSKQVNDLTFVDGKGYCTVHDSRLFVENPDNYEFSLSNPAQDIRRIEILRIYSETRDSDYSLIGITQTDGTIKLQRNSLNTSIGLSASDIVLIDYSFESETTEYAPVVVNYLNIEQDAETIYIENSDLTSLVDSTALLNLSMPDTAEMFLFSVSDVSYDGFGTRIGITPPVAESLVNPKLYVTDSTVGYLPVPLPANPFITGSTVVSFTGENISEIFRPKTVLAVNSERYSVSGVSYDWDSSSNNVSLRSEIISDTTDSVSLSNVSYSDVPIYLENDAEIVPQRPIVTLLDQPAFIMCNNSDSIIEVNTDSTALYVDGTSFLYSAYPTLGDMSSAIFSANISAMAFLTYVPLWQSEKITPTERLFVYRDSSAVLSAFTALRSTHGDVITFNDNTNFSVAESGNVILDNPLVAYDRYRADYMGREFLGDASAEYSANFFVDLNSGAKVSASFEYDNLDQFYVEVMSQRDFFENVTVPRMEEEAFQLNGNVGQGGELVGDSGGSASSGGLTDDFYKKQDMEIECRVFENIYDFFSNRVEAMGDEMDAAIGLRLFNNDGIYNKVEQAAGHKSVTRIFPSPDYTNFEPMIVNPLTGYFITYGAVFTKNSDNVSSISGKSYWLTQLAVGDFIGLSGSTKKYRIRNVIDDTHLVLFLPYDEKSTSQSSINDGVGDTYTASTSYPLYDDDGNLGFKLESTKTSKFGLSDGDVFDCTIDGVGYSATFENPPPPPLFPLTLYLMFNVRFYDAADVAKVLSSIDGLVCTVERIVDPGETFGYRDSLVLRSSGRANKIVLGTGSAVRKLGFSHHETSYGNFNRDDHRPEVVLDDWERYHLGVRLDPPNPRVPGNEIDDLQLVKDAGTIFKLTRIDSTNLERIDDAYARVSDEYGFLATERVRLRTEIKATDYILQEPTLPPYAQTLIANENARTQLYDIPLGTDDAYGYASRIVSDWEGKDVNWRWSLDFTEESTFIRYKDTVSNIGYDTTALGRISLKGQTDFILEAPSGNDRRILNADLSLIIPSASFYTPNIVYEAHTNINVPGDWSGWSNSPFIDGSYSDNNQILFTLDSPILFSISRSIITLPHYTSDSSALALHWAGFDGAHKKEFFYSSYPTVSNLMAAINAVDGFGTLPDLYNVANYAYSDLYPFTNLPVPLPQGDTLWSGPNSPAFKFHTVDNATNLMFSMYSTDIAAPLYDIDGTALVIDRIDGTNTYKNEFLYSSYNTIGALETAIDSVTNMHITSNFESSFIYDSLVLDSGTVAIVAPGTPVDNAKLPIYRTDLNAFVIERAVGTSVVEYEYLYSTYPHLGDLQLAIASTPNIVLDRFFDPVYLYGNFGAQTGSVSRSAPGTTFLLPAAPLFKLYFEMTDVRFETDTTALNILWEQNSETVRKNFTYIDYPLVIDMKTVVNDVTLLYVTGFSGFDPEYSEVFRIDSGLIDPSVTIHRGLSDSTVAYQTISDALFDDRIPYATDRVSVLTDRIIYLESRESEIKGDLKSEEILKDEKGNPSDLYIWANNRYNRRQGCYAKLKQIEKQIESNESALGVNRYLVS